MNKFEKAQQILQDINGDGWLIICSEDNDVNSRYMLGVGSHALHCILISANGDHHIFPVVMEANMIRESLKNKGVEAKVTPYASIKELVSLLISSVNKPRIALNFGENFLAPESTHYADYLPVGKYNAIKKLFPKTEFFSAAPLIYGLRSVKSQEELNILYENKLNLIYYGIETGSNLVLKKITKGVSQGEIIDSLNRASASGMKVSATVILGIGGEKYSKEHIKESAEIINATRVNYLSTLQLGLEEDAKDNFYKHFSDFIALDDFQILEEQKRFLELLHPLNKIIFRSNHASNALHLSGTLPRDKDRLVKEVAYALEIGEDAFVPSVFRGF